MISKDSKVLFSIFEKGTIRLKKSNAGSKKEKSKIMSSPFVKKSKDGLTFSFDSEKWIKAIEGKAIPKYYESRVSYNEPEYNEVVIKTTINEATVQFFISDEGRPSSIKSFIWNKMDDKARLEANLAINANGKSFTYTIID